MEFEGFLFGRFEDVLIRHLGGLGDGTGKSNFFVPWKVDIALVAYVAMYDVEAARRDPSRTWA